MQYNINNQQPNGSNPNMMYNNDPTLMYNNKIPIQPNMIIDQNNTLQTQNKFQYNNIITKDT